MEFVTFATDLGLGEIPGEFSCALLLMTPVLADEHPEVYVALPVGLATGDAAVHQDTEDVVQSVDECIDGLLHRLLELGLWDAEHVILGCLNSVTVDANKFLVALRGNDDEIVVFEKVDGEADRPVGCADQRGEFPECVLLERAIYLKTIADRSSRNVGKDLHFSPALGPSPGLLLIQSLTNRCYRSFPWILRVSVSI